VKAALSKTIEIVVEFGYVFGAVLAAAPTIDHESGFGAVVTPAAAALLDDAVPIAAAPSGLA
jgi:hypothetical protein